MKNINKILSIRTNSILCCIVLFSACQTLPEGYVENLTTGSWKNTEQIQTSGGLQTVVRTQTFAPDGVYRLEINHPVNGPSVQEYRYSVGYSSPKPAFVLYELISTNDQLTMVGTPNFFEFYANNEILKISTNSGMSLSTIWTR